jgi:hypothetical protein
LAVAPATSDDGAAVDQAIEDAPATDAGTAKVASKATAAPATTIFVWVLRGMVASRPESFGDISPPYSRFL